MCSRCSTITPVMEAASCFCVCLKVWHWDGSLVRTVINVFGLKKKKKFNVS